MAVYRNNSFPEGIWRSSWSFETSEIGFRVSGGPWIPWTEVAALKDDRYRRGLALFGGDGRRLATFPYNADDAIHAIDGIRARIPAVPKFHFERRHRVLRTVVWALALLVFLYVEPLVSAALVVVGVIDAIRELRTVDLEGDTLVLRYAFRERRLARSEVSRVALLLERVGRGARQPRVAVHLRSRGLVVLRGAGDPVELATALESWLDASSTSI